MLHSRWIKWAALAFVAFYLFTRPDQAAHAVHGAFGLVQTGANSVATFFTAVTK